MSRLVLLLRRMLWAVLEDFVTHLSGPLGWRARTWYWRCRVRSCGQGVNFGVGVRIYNPEYVAIGDNCWIDDYVIILAGPPIEGQRHVAYKSNEQYTGELGEVRIGDRVHIAPFVLLSGHGGLDVGSDTTVASGAKVFSFSHHYSSKERSDSPEAPFCFSSRAPEHRQALICAPVVIGQASAVGLNAVVLPGSSIGSGSWLSVGATALGDYPAGQIIISAGAGTVMKPRWRTGGAGA